MPFPAVAMYNTTIATQALHQRHCSAYGWQPKSSNLGPAGTTAHHRPSSPVLLSLAWGLCPSCLPRCPHLRHRLCRHCHRHRHLPAPRSAPPSSSLPPHARPLRAPRWPPLPEARRSWRPNRSSLTPAYFMQCISQARSPYVTLHGLIAQLLCVGAPRRETAG